MTVPETARHASELADPLTGLGTRVKLLVDLERGVEPAGPTRTLAIFAVAGLDEYSELYGRLRRQELVLHLAGRLPEALADHAPCYQPRRDEFAALLDEELADAMPRLRVAARALEERFARFGLGFAFGAALLPVEAATPVEALRLADERRGSAGRGSAQPAA